MSCCYGTPTDIPVTKQTVKIVILGNSAVGKTTLIHRLSTPVTDNYELPNEILTVGAAYINLRLGEVECNIWDTAGQERYRAVTPIYLRNSDICVIAYSLVDEQSKKDTVIWEEFISTYSPNAVKVFIATMQDIRSPDATCLSESDVVISSLTGCGIQELKNILGIAAKSTLMPR
jgi:small GTP-binding protein